MEKLLACGLILSTLMSFGSVCFAGRDIVVLDDDSASETEIDYHAGEDEDEYGDDYIGEIAKGRQDRKETKKPRRPRGDKEDTKPKRKYKKSAAYIEQEELTYLRNQAMDLAIVYYSCSEMVEMKIGDLNEDHTILTVNGEIKRLPACVVEALGEYLAKRAELAPGTMGAEKPLFIDCKNAQRIKQGLPITKCGVNRGIFDYRKANGQIADMEE